MRKNIRVTRSSYTRKAQCVTFEAFLNWSNRSDNTQWFHTHGLVSVPNVLTIDCIGRPDVDTNLHPGLGGSGSKHGDGANSEYLPPIPGGSASGVVAQA